MVTSVLVFWLLRSGACPALIKGKPTRRWTLFWRLRKCAVFPLADFIRWLYYCFCKLVSRTGRASSSGVCSVLWLSASKRDCRYHPPPPQPTTPAFTLQPLGIICYYGITPRLLPPRFPYPTAWYYGITPHLLPSRLPYPTAWYYGITPHLLPSLSNRLVLWHYPSSLTTTTPSTGDPSCPPFDHYVHPRVQWLIVLVLSSCVPVPSVEVCPPSLAPSLPPSIFPSPLPHSPPPCVPVPSVEIFAPSLLPSDSRSSYLVHRLCILSLFQCPRQVVTLPLSLPACWWVVYLLSQLMGCILSQPGDGLCTYSVSWWVVYLLSQLMGCVLTQSADGMYT